MAQSGIYLKLNKLYAMCMHQQKLDWEIAQQLTSLLCKHNYNHHDYHAHKNIMTCLARSTTKLYYNIIYTPTGLDIGSLTTQIWKKINHIP